MKRNIKVTFFVVIAMHLETNKKW